MDQKIFSKFSFYDQIGYILVGSIVLIVAFFDAWILKYQLPKISGADLAVLVIIAYFLGHLTQSVANLFIKEKKYNFSKQEIEILNIAREKFNLKEKSDNEIYRLCYMLSLAKDFSGQVETFNAYYSLYRGWLLVFVLQSIFLTYRLISVFNFEYLIFLLVSIAIAILFFLRLKRFYKYSREKTLQTFLIVNKLKL